MKLNIGSGKTLLEGYVNIDASHPAADVQADMRHLPYDDGTVDEIYSAHALEHVPFRETQAVLSEWRRVLKPEGRLRLVVPSMDWVAGAWLHGHDTDYARQITFGNQEHDGEFHKNGWRERDLRADVEAAGFTEIDTVVRWTAEYSQESIILEVTR